VGPQARRAEKARRIWPDGLRGKDGALTQSWKAIAVRALSHVLALAAVAFVLIVTLAPARAESVDGSVVPMPVPDDLVLIRSQPALGATLVPLAPGQQPLTPALLSNYIQRQQALRSVELTPASQGELNSEVLMGYISRGSFGGNSAVNAIADFTSEFKPAAAQPDDGRISPGLLAAYVAEDYQPLEARLQHANSERDCLAQAIYHEARGESLDGQLAVANVIVNRARSSKFPSTLCGVIYQNADKGRYRCQFTFACDGRTDTPRERSAWQRSAELAKQIYAGFATGDAVGKLPGSALYYHTTAVRPSWASTYNAVATIDSHIFYSPN